MRKTLPALFCALLAFAAAGQSVEVAQKWVYSSANMLLDSDVDALLAVMKDAKAAGATHAQLNDYQFGFLGDMPPRYFENAGKVREAAAALGLELVPGIFSIGQSGRYLYNDPNLADGIPVRDVRFIVNGGVAKVDPSLAPAIVNAGFDEAEGEGLVGWRFVEPEGVKMYFIDTEVKHSGKASVRATRPEGQRRRDETPYGVVQTVRVKPFHTYRLCAWVKADGITPSEHSIAVIGSRDKRVLTYQWLAIKPTQDWTQHKIAFNSLDHDEVELYVGFETTRGTIWFDDVSIEPAGLLNVLRRELTPLKVTSQDRKTAYQECADFKYVQDSKLGVAPTRGDFMVVSRGTYDIWHEGPSIELTANSRIKDGDAILVSFFSPTVIYEKQQVTVSVSEPKVFEIMEDEMRRVSALFGAKSYFMNYDEIRSAGWEDQPGGAHLSPGELLAKHVTRAVEIVRKYAPGAAIYVWSDMFDPYHNAPELKPGDYYYFANGAWYGSWEGLPKEVGIVNWIGRPESLKWFADRGHRQIVSISLDSGPVDRATRRFERAAGVPNVVGYMYTTWSKRYDNMAPFFKLLSEWTPPEVQPQPQEPAAHGREDVR